MGNLCALIHLKGPESRQAVIICRWPSLGAVLSARLWGRPPPRTSRCSLPSPVRSSKLVQIHRRHQTRQTYTWTTAACHTGARRQVARHRVEGRRHRAGGHLRTRRPGKLPLLFIIVWSLVLKPAAALACLWPDAPFLLESHNHFVQFANAGQSCVAGSRTFVHAGESHSAVCYVTRALMALRQPRSGSEH